MNAAERILLAVDPLVPALIADNRDDWNSLRNLSEAVKEFGWNGARESPAVRRMLAAVEASKESGDDEPLTVSWLKQVGFKPDDERPFYWTNAKSIHSLKTACFDLMIWQNGTWEVANADNSIILRTHAGTRGDLRKLCGVLNIPLKEECIP